MAWRQPKQLRDSPIQKSYQLQDLKASNQLLAENHAINAQNLKAQRNQLTDLLDSNLSLMEQIAQQRAFLDEYKQVVQQKYEMIQSLDMHMQKTLQSFESMVKQSRSIRIFRESGPLKSTDVAPTPNDENAVNEVSSPNIIRTSQVFGQGQPMKEFDTHCVSNLDDKAKLVDNFQVALNTPSVSDSSPTESSSPTARVQCKNLTAEQYSSSPLLLQHREVEQLQDVRKSRRMSIWKPNMTPQGLSRKLDALITGTRQDSDIIDDTIFEETEYEDSHSRQKYIEEMENQDPMTRKKSARESAGIVSTLDGTPKRPRRESSRRIQNFAEPSLRKQDLYLLLKSLQSKSLTYICVQKVETR
ncbi:hypothetical protein MIR68_000623 [Amoeboaphelidium protococcarum]|nr:hypothetical protein MIR68_000623 [Amoeboaphelidium protococcarum]